jgi:hypothetical protein
MWSVTKLSLADGWDPARHMTLDVIVHSMVGGKCRDIVHTGVTRVAYDWWLTMTTLEHLDKMGK